MRTSMSVNPFLFNLYSRRGWSESDLFLGPLRVRQCNTSYRTCGIRIELGVVPGQVAQIKGNASGDGLRGSLIDESARIALKDITTRIWKKDPMLRIG
jgi:hypothetical protein